jgi:hypothetical protein
VPCYVSIRAERIQAVYISSSWNTKIRIPCQCASARGVASDGNDAPSAILAPALCDRHQTDPTIRAILIAHKDYGIGDDVVEAAAGKMGKARDATGTRLRFCLRHELLKLNLEKRPSAVAS